MDVRVSVAVMAHKRRAHLVDDLVAALDREPVVTWDERDDRWDTGRRAILAADPEATHHVVIQDDAIVCRDLCAGIEHMYGFINPERPMGLYFGSRVPHSQRYSAMYRRARRRNARWIEVQQSPMWGVGLVIPTAHVADLVRYADQVASPAYDGRVRRWYRRHHIPQMFPIPSLVDHRTGPDHPSLIRDRRSPEGRVAHQFIGEDASPLDLDWNTPVIR